MMNNYNFETAQNAANFIAYILECAQNFDKNNATEYENAENAGNEMLCDIIVDAANGFYSGLEKTVRNAIAGNVFPGYNSVLEIYADNFSEMYSGVCFYAFDEISEPERKIFMNAIEIREIV